MRDIKVAAATAEILGDDSMVIAGGILPEYVSGQEGKIRISAIVIEGNIKLCIVSCDILMIQRDILDEVCRRMGQSYWIGLRKDALRPTGPFDPELPVMAFKRADGNVETFSLITPHITLEHANLESARLDFMDWQHRS